MRQKVIIGISVCLLIGVMVLIVTDLFEKPSQSRDPDVYDIDRFRKIDPDGICYRETGQILTGLNGLQGIAVDSGLNVYVCGNRTVRVYSPAWEALSDFTVNSDAFCVAAGRGGKICIGLGNHIGVFDLSGNRTGNWPALNERSFITSLTATGDEIFAADAVNRILLRFDRDGRILNTIGKKDPEKGIEGFLLPGMYFDVAAGPDGDLWVANTGRHEMEQFSADGSLISFWGKASFQPEGFAGCCNPVHFAVMTDGCFITYEKGLDRIKLFSQAGDYQCTIWGPSGSEGSSPASCSVSPAIRDLAVDREGKVYALDGGGSVIRVFARKQQEEMQHGRE